jgi:2'-5' RNA ligase
LTDGQARLFVALTLPDDVRGALEAWQAESLAGLTGLRPVAPDALHVTLCFLGSQDVGQIDPILATCRTAVTSPVAGLSLGRPLWLPARGPRVLAAGVNDPDRALAEAQESLSAALSSGGWFTPEARPFLAHVTVARVRRGVRVQPVELPAPPAVPFDRGRVTLYRSWLGRGRARYEALS